MFCVLRGSWLVGVNRGVFGKMFCVVSVKYEGYSFFVVDFRIK